MKHHDPVKKSAPTEKAYTYTGNDGKVQKLTQDEAEDLLVAKNHCVDTAAAKKLLSAGKDIDVPAHGKDPAGVLSCDED